MEVIVLIVTLIVLACLANVLLAALALRSIRALLEQTDDQFRTIVKGLEVIEIGLKEREEQPQKEQPVLEVPAAKGEALLCPKCRRPLHRFRAGIPDRMVWTCMTCDTVKEE